MAGIQRLRVGDVDLLFCFHVGFRCSGVWFEVGVVWRALNPYHECMREFWASSASCRLVEPEL